MSKKGKIVGKVMLANKEVRGTWEVKLSFLRFVSQKRRE